ncbi:predicted protein [Naegleria gruberi]|uniref:Predicted protein n=1 Tax=Naegleria gruberi TaxID=5762 RepID=D2VKJ9_NAEGR|nr:uncharacterized protein NAEGRDRAFT_50308 [Naegleria gruberi]EFC42609.1 predicted protein [Naegleria gruberi]|eukprot:XP_002675353.1 predicted protein [Naegleria gruberi strain NEG-M]
MLLSTSNPTPSSQVTVKKSGENMLFNNSTFTNNSSNTPNSSEEQKSSTSHVISSSLSPLALQPITTTPNHQSKPMSMEVLSSSYPQQHESKPSSDSIIPPPRMQPPTTTNFPIITSSNPSIRSTTTGHPTFHSSFPIMTNNFLAPPLFSSSKIHSTSSVPTITTLQSSSVSPNSLISSINNTPTKSSLDNVPKPVPTASSILAPSLSLIETESISPQPIRVSTILSSFNTPSDSSKSAIGNSNNSSNSQTESVSTTTTPKITRVRKLTPRRVPDLPLQQEQQAGTTKQASEPTTPTKEQPTRTEAESNPFTTLYSKPLSSFPLHHPSSSMSGSSFSPFPPPTSHSRLVSPSTPSPISLWPSTTVTTSTSATPNKHIVPPPLLPPLNVSPPNTKKRRTNSQESVGASLQPLTPLTPPTPSAQFPFPSVRLSSATPPPGYVPPPPFPISSASLIPVVKSNVIGPPERKVSSNTPPPEAKPKKKENMVGCNSIRIPFRSWMKTLDTLSAPSLRAVQERVTQLLEKKEEEKKKNLLAKQQKQETSSSSNRTTKLSCSNDTLSLLSTDLSSIDTLAILALADSPPSPTLAKSSELISESVELFSKSPDKSMMIESDDSEEESEEEIDINLKIAQAEPFVREYSGNGFIYPGRRGAKSQRVRLPICFYPSMKSVLASESSAETFVEGEDSINPVIDLEHHLEFFIDDSDRKLYNSIRGLHLVLLKRISKTVYIEESSVLVQRSSRSDDGGYNFSIINQTSLHPPLPGQRQADYSLLLVEPRGKRRNAQDVDKVNRYCEIIHEQGNQCKIRVGFRICKAQKKKHTKGVYLLRLVACISDEAEIKFDSSNQPINGVMKVLEESELFKIVSRRVTANSKPTASLKRKMDDDEVDSSSE